MNIKFGMDNLYVRYLKRFLNHEMSNKSAVLGDFDRTDLNMLIKYLNLPNVKTMFEVQTDMENEFEELKSLFTITLRDDVIQWTSKAINLEASNFLLNNLNTIKDYCTSLGWELFDVYSWFDINKDINNDGIVDNIDRTWVYNICTSEDPWKLNLNGQDITEEIYNKADVNRDGAINLLDVEEMDKYLNTGHSYLIIKKSNRKNYFPNKDMLVFVNQFTGDFMYNYAIRDERGDTPTDRPHYNPDNKYKIGIYECKPRTKNNNIT